MARSFLRSLVLTAGIFSMLVWLYVVARAIINGANLNTPFIDSIPSILIWQVGVIAFILAFFCTFVYLALWYDFDHRCKKP
jgi:sterol desaturase/sphingolipid hydroxylase (fatty acid hydroxylase superfamily)